MAKRRCQLIAAGFLILSSCAKGTDFDVASYPQATFARVLEANVPPAAFDESTLIAGSAQGYTVRVQCGGQHRNLRPSIRRLLEARDSELGEPLAVPLFRNEVQIRDGDAAYWLPIQESLMSHWTGELSLGHPVELRISLLGMIGLDQIYLINGFRALASPTE